MEACVGLEIQADQWGAWVLKKGEKCSVMWSLASIEEAERSDLCC